MSRTKKFIVEVICWLLIILFFYSAWDKLSDYQKFRVQLGQSPLLTWMAGFVAWFIPVVEIIVSVMLRIRLTRLIGLYAAFGLMVMFTTYVIIVNANYRDVLCSCNGIMESLGWTEHIIVNASFSGLAMIGILLVASDRTPKPEFWKTIRN